MQGVDVTDCTLQMELLWRRIKDNKRRRRQQRQSKGIIKDWNYKPVLLLLWFPEKKGIEH